MYFMYVASYAASCFQFWKNILFADCFTVVNNRNRNYN